MVFIFALGVNSAVMSDEAIRLNRGGVVIRINASCDDDCSLFPPKDEDHV
jgi:hypothetical protein